MRKIQKLSDDIPFDIQIEIITRLPVKSLLRFRSVSNSWKSLIDSSMFNADYNLRHAQRSQHLFIRCKGQVSNNNRYLTSMDNDDSCLPEQKALPSPLKGKRLGHSKVIGMSHGLLCFCGYYRKKGDSVYSSRAVIWNPSIRKSVDIDMPDVTSHPRAEGHVVGFGVCPDTTDPKIVKIDDFGRHKHINNLTCKYWQVKIFTLSAGVWRSKHKLNHVPSRSIDISSYRTVVADRFIYWLATNGRSSMILSFDLTSEEFKTICLPDKLAAHYFRYLNIYKLRESLVVVECNEKFEKQVYTTWMMMEDGISKSFTRLYTVNLEYDWFRTVVGFRDNGQLILETKHDEEYDVVDNKDYENDEYFDNEDVNEDDDDKSVVLVAYEPCSKRIKKLQIYGKSYSFGMSYYKESLLLHNEPKTIR